VAAGAVEVMDRSPGRHLRPVELDPVRRRRWVRWLVPAAIGLLAIIAWGMKLPARYVAATQPSLPASSPEESVPFDLCFSDVSWVPPDAEAQAAHLLQNPRYAGIDFSRLRPERIHVEGGPFRSASAFGDFIELSGLWADDAAVHNGCPEAFQGKVEVWGLAVRFQRLALRGDDLNAILERDSRGVQVAQIALPPGALALHFLDGSGEKLAPDVALGR